jgi:nitroimidazol reductase NimA-like FMN-containing flavoprotein (pyridoxamine 5'-phosphate oxidase superfamily)
MPDVEGYGPQLKKLSGDECYALLKSHSVGRLGVIVDGYPEIVPVNYAMDQFTVVLRSKPGTKLSAAEHHNVTFEVDDINRSERTGWSVLVRGQGEMLSPAHSEAVRESTEHTGVKPWVPGDDFQWLRIIPHGISGRRISPSAANDWWWGTGTYR